MKLMMRTIGALISVNLILAISLSWAQAANETQLSPVELIKSRNQTVESIVRKQGESVDEQTRERLKEVINGIMDFEELSRLALGKYWDERTEQEKKDFVNVFSQLIKNSSVKKLEIYKADRMVYEDPEIQGDKAKVTTYAYKDRKEVEVVYKMHKQNVEWRVYDMEIDGVSTARNYRDSFYKEIAKTSYAAMYQKLKDRLEESKD